MKESKKFFEDNRLNRGCSQASRNNKSDNDSALYAKYKHVLPPLDILEQYEELHPGTTQKLLEMAEKEQSHRHDMELRAFKKHHKAVKLGRLVLVALGTVVIASSLSVISGYGAIATIILAAALLGILGGLHLAPSVFAKRSASVAPSMDFKNPNHERVKSKNRFRRHRKS
jgi:uncharacterized membrane protein